MNEQIKEKLENKEFVTKVLECKDEKEVKELFSKDGINVTDEEIQVLGIQINALAEELEKLPENELEEISGGVLPLQQVHKALNYLPVKLQDAITKGNTKPDSKGNYSISQKIGGEAARALFIGEIAAIAIGTYVLAPKAANAVKNWWSNL